jgi:hypothetical protein
MKLSELGCAGQYFITGAACPADSKQITEDDFNLQGPGGDIHGSLMPSMRPPNLTQENL